MRVRVLLAGGVLAVWSCLPLRAQTAGDACAVGRLGRTPQTSVEATKLTPLLPGVTLPVMLERTLHAGGSRPGTRIVAKTTQRIPLGQDTYLGRGAELDGIVTESSQGDGTAAHPARLGLRFTRLRWHGMSVPVTLRAVALANFTDVQATGAPVAGFADIVNPDESNWTTRQIGGDEIYRSDWLGPVCNNVMRAVGRADFYGVYSLPGEPVGGVTLPFARALDVFSSDVHGVYGFGDGTTLGGDAGAIEVTTLERRLTLAGEDRMLLVVLP